MSDRNVYIYLSLGTFPLNQLDIRFPERRTQNPLEVAWNVDYAVELWGTPSF